MWAVVDASLLIANDKLRSWYTIHEKRYTLSKIGRDMDTFYLANLYNQWPTTVFAPTRWIYLQLGVANNHLKKKKKVKNDINVGGYWNWCFEFCRRWTNLTCVCMCVRACERVNRVQNVLIFKNRWNWRRKLFIVFYGVGEYVVHENKILEGKKRKKKKKSEMLLDSNRLICITYPWNFFQNRHSFFILSIHYSLLFSERNILRCYKERNRFCENLDALSCCKFA